MRNVAIATAEPTWPFISTVSATGNCLDCQYPDGWYYQDDYADWSAELTRYFQ